MPVYSFCQKNRSTVCAIVIDRLLRPVQSTLKQGMVLTLFYLTSLVSPRGIPHVHTATARQTTEPYPNRCHSAEDRTHSQDTVLHTFLIQAVTLTASLYSIVVVQLLQDHEMSTGCQR